MRRSGFKVALIVVMLLAGSPAQETRYWASPLRPVLEVLDKAKLSGSLQYSGRCESGTLPDFPPSRAPSSGGSPLQTLREVLADDPSIQVRQDPAGAIRIIESGVQTDLLDVTISHIQFEDFAHNGIYTANDALRVILRAPEVVAFVESRDIKGLYGPEAVPGNSGRWPPELPHISQSLDNVTLSQALDYVLRTFPGIWVYENCPPKQESSERKRVVFLRFFSIQRNGDRVYVIGG